MPAPAGNQFWKMRTIHGRGKIFTEPKILLEAAYQYFEYQSGRTWIKHDVVKGGEFTGQMLEVPTQTPFSMRLLCLYLGVHSKYLLEFEQALKPKENAIDKEFSDVITHIREIIEEQQLEGATVGAFNANIVSRRLGLADKINAEHTGKDGGAIKTDTTFKIELIDTGAGVSNSEKLMRQAVAAELGEEYTDEDE